MDIASLDISTLKGITQDSRKVEAGYLFAAIKGEKVDGRDYILKAIESGATYILAEEGTPAHKGATLITSPNPRRALAQLAAQFYPDQPNLVAAVTGTNGKTSVVSFLEHLWRAAGYKSASLGTLSGNMTTLETVALHEELQKQSKSGVTHMAMEASSHGLEQCRIHGVNVHVAGFTNLTRDHLDYHGTMDAYCAAKRKLFSEVLASDGVAVLNADVAEYPELKAAFKGRIISYGQAGQDLRMIERSLTPHGQVLALGVNGQPFTLSLPLVGHFQAMNALCALGMAMAYAPDKFEIFLETLEHINGAPGRLQSVKGHPEGAGVYVDYAHTPDALENVLNALRPHTEGRLICVFGCGGDRDTGKRPQMGKISMRLADITIVTDDNPRSEEPASIRSDILSQADGAIEIEGRKAAIQKAVDLLRKGDILVIAGKGHEQGQIFKDHTEPFDDVAVAASAIASFTPSNL